MRRSPRVTPRSIGAGQRDSAVVVVVVVVVIAGVLLRDYLMKFHPALLSIERASSALCA